MTDAPPTPAELADAAALAVAAGLERLSTAELARLALALRRREGGGRRGLAERLENTAVIPPPPWPARRGGRTSDRSSGHL